MKLMSVFNWLIFSFLGHFLMFCWCGEIGRHERFGQCYFIERKEKVMKKTISFFSCIILILLLAGCSMKNLPTGDFLKSSVSPNDTYQVNAYVCDGGATTDYSVRC